MRKNVLFFFILGILFCLPYFVQLFISTAEGLIYFHESLSYFEKLFLIMQIPTVIALIFNFIIELQDNEKFIKKLQQIRTIVQHITLALLMCIALILNMSLLTAFMLFPS